jgi:hexokinase
MLPLTPAQLGEIRSALSAKIAEGLHRDGAQIKALPAFLGPPPADLEGRVLAVDTGGTNMRAAVVELGAQDRIVAGPVHAQVPAGRDGEPVSADEFFGAHAALVERLGGVRGLPIGYCFSYPSESLPDHDARLIRWTKGLQVEGVEGTAVGAALSRALAARGLQPGPVVVLNDTVASLIAGARGSAAPERTIGLIVGTGSNMAGFFDQEAVPKLKAAWRGPIAINLESGNFHPPHLASFDDEVDRQSENAGAQRFEKAVSGYYLPQLYQAIDPQRAPPGGAALVERANAGDTIARSLIDRSADLVAVGLAALADFSGPAPVRVLAEGGLFWSPSGYSARVQATLERLGRPLEIARRADANLIGAAAAALSP